METTADPTPPLSPSPDSRSNNPTPPSSTPNHDKTAANGDRKDSEPRERKKITVSEMFLIMIICHVPVSFPFSELAHCMCYDRHPVLQAKA